MWPQTNCWSLNKQWSDTENTCSICKLPYNGWTLHGLWPSSRHGGDPSFCHGNAFKANFLSSDLKKELSKKWSSYKLRSRPESFWGYEYKKHGSCALDLDSTNSVSKYFAKSLELLDKYNVGMALKQSNIHPGGQYTTLQVYQALQRVFGKNVKMQCKSNPVRNVIYTIHFKQVIGSRIFFQLCGFDFSKPMNSTSWKLAYASTNLSIW